MNIELISLFCEVRSWNCLPGTWRLHEIVSMGICNSHVAYSTDMFSMAEGTHGRDENMHTGV